MLKTAFLKTEVEGQNPTESAVSLAIREII